jgi:hypothetical protein
LVCRAGTPDIVSRIQQEAAKSANTLAIMKSRWPAGRTPGGNIARVSHCATIAEHKKWAQVVKNSGAKVD